MSETNTKVDPTGGARVAKAKGNTSVGMIAMYAGAISGGIECVAVWPMEYIKTQLQVISMCLSYS